MAGKQLSSINPKKIQLKIDGIDMTGIFSNMNIYQDVFQPTWTAVLSIEDTENIMMNDAIKQGSRVSIKVEVDTANNSDEFTFKFIIYKISDKHAVKQDVLRYNIHCVAESYFNNLKTRIQKSYKAMKGEDIVSNAIARIGGVVEADISSAPMTMIAANWTPFKLTSWISKHTKGVNGGADYLFFQSNDNDKYAFRSIDKIFKSHDTGIEFSRVRQEEKEDNNSVYSGDVFTGIMKMKFTKHQDSLANMVQGYYGSKSITYDVINKKIITDKFSYADDIGSDNTGKPFDSDLFNNAFDSNISQHFLHEGIAGGESSGEQYKDWLLSRKNNIMKLDQNVLMMQVPGDVAWRDHIGKTVRIKIPSDQDLVKEPYDKYLKGKFLVLAIRHILTQDGSYTMVYELCKKKLNEDY